jgi:surface carbohydrate biosynthesis protein
MDGKPPLIIPVENQVRELDPKLLLALVAARRGFPSVIGNLREVDLRIASFPRSIYLCKSMTERNLKIFDILRRLGHEVVSWDEEALVHLPDEIYYSRRLSPVVLGYLTHLFAWGEDNAELWRRYPGLPEGMPIHVTGNPRNDLLRPELLPFYQEEADQIRCEHGDFILVNTNFNHVNAFYAAQNLFVPAKPGDPPRFGKAGVGMTLEFAEALRDQKQAVFEAFQELIPALDRAFPKHEIIVRPHPTEGQDVYREIASRCERVQVTNEGNVVPWLMGAQGLVHNGCTTGVEAFAMRVPAISYRPRVDERVDDGFYRLPHGLSHQCFDLDSVISTLQGAVAGKIDAADGAERKDLFDRHMVALDGPTACERIVDVVEQIADSGRGLPSPSLPNRVSGWCLANGRRSIKRWKVMLPWLWERARYYRHRYPEVQLERIRGKISRFERLLGEGRPVQVRELSEGIFWIDSEEGGRR